MHELHVQCIQIDKTLVHCTCKLCREQKILQKSGLHVDVHEAPPKWELKEYYGIFCFGQQSIGLFSNRTGTSVDDEKAKVTSGAQFVTAISQASCLICNYSHQLTFPFCC